MSFDVNWLAVMAATVANMVVGAFWYSPLLCGRKWMGYLNLKEEDLNNPGKGYLYSFLAAFVMAFVLAVFITNLNLHGLGAGLLAGGVAAVGFTAAPFVQVYVFESKPTGLFFLTVGHHGVAFLVMGAILGVWR